MSEIEKMYARAMIKPLSITVCGVDEQIINYPPFTAEKQLEMIKLIANSKGYPDYEYFGNLFDDYIQLLEFDEALAKLVNDLWAMQYLTEEEKQQVKGILE